MHHHRPLRHSITDILSAQPVVVADIQILPIRNTSATCKESNLSLQCDFKQRFRRAAMNGTRTKDQRPCDNCRRRKIRCLFGSDEAVNCVLCISRSTECTYIRDAAPKKRRHSLEAEKIQDSGRPNQRYLQTKTGRVPVSSITVS